MVRRKQSTVRNISFRCGQTPTSIAYKVGMPGGSNVGSYGEVTAPADRFALSK
jgi:hypothetical protein